MRHGAFLRIDQQHHAVDHGQSAFNFAAEVRVSRCVDDVDVCATPADRAVFRQNGDAALALNGVVVHDGIHHFFVVGKGAGLTQQLVNHGGFTVVNVGNDGDVSNL